MHGWNPPEDEELRRVYAEGAGLHPPDRNLPSRHQRQIPQVCGYNFPLCVDVEPSVKCITFCQICVVRFEYFV